MSTKTPAAPAPIKGKVAADLLSALEAIVQTGKDGEAIEACDNLAALLPALKKALAPAKPVSKRHNENSNRSLRNLILDVRTIGSVSPEDYVAQIDQARAYGYTINDPAVLACEYECRLRISAMDGGNSSEHQARIINGSLTVGTFVELEHRGPGYVSRASGIYDGCRLSDNTPYYYFRDGIINDEPQSHFGFPTSHLVTED